jgi:DMSO/TMAO reductase YedYZ molybdopterin-dependent catalytic subunit
MALFIVRHEHDKDHCPATDPFAGAMLLNHLSRPTVAQYGIAIRAEAVVKGQHAMFMIVEADDEGSVQAFLEPFAHAGTVDVYPASTCAGVVASGGCAATPLRLDDVVPAVDPEEACQTAIEAGLVVHRAHPLNCETSVPALVGGVVMPNAHFYVRNHFQIPDLDGGTWRLAVGGLVERPLEISLKELRTMPSQTAFVTLECAGNGRFALTPPTPGEQWRLGAVSTAEWTGVPLTEVLDRAGVQTGATDLVFRGADNGTVDDRTEPVCFERGLGLDVARQSGALLAYAMNGEAIPVHHGYPVRLIVPNWYGVASVKWLTGIDVVDEPFAGYYQEVKYQFEWSDGDRPPREPVALQRVRALITEPGDNAIVERGDVAIRGVAWSGAAPIARVDVSVNDGPWQAARLVGDRRPGSWQWWELITQLDQPGPVAIRARARDMAGRSQPDEPEWNPNGYGNNAVQPLHVHCH